MKKLGIIFIIVFLTAGHAGAALDLMFIVDESGSMSGEHEWIGDMVTSLDSELVSAGESSNRYALVGFGAGTSDGGPKARKHLLGSVSWGSAAKLSAATEGLVTSGCFEDGWEGIVFGLKKYYFRSDAVTNMILITDEDRDPVDPQLTYDYVLSKLTAKSVMLNVIVDCGFQDGTGAVALGVGADGTAYLADGSGGYSIGSGGVMVSPYYNTDVCYVELAWATGGAAWDIELLRKGGLLAESFTTAFIDVKVSEIVSTPAPGAFLLVSIGIGTIGWFKRRKIL